MFHPEGLRTEQCATISSSSSKVTGELLVARLTISMHEFKHIVDLSPIAPGTQSLRWSTIDDHLPRQLDIVLSVEQDLDAIVRRVQSAVDVAGTAVPERRSTQRQSDLLTRLILCDVM
jgi:hypothetical protein